MNNISDVAATVRACHGLLDIASSWRGSSISKRAFAVLEICKEIRSEGTWLTELANILAKLNTVEEQEREREQKDLHKTTPRDLHFLLTYLHRLGEVIYCSPLEPETIEDAQTMYVVVNTDELAERVARIVSSNDAEMLAEQGIWEMY